MGTRSVYEATQEPIATQLQFVMIIYISFQTPHCLKQKRSPALKLSLKKALIDNSVMSESDRPISNRDSLSKRDSKRPFCGTLTT
ncbi:hypothetical protein IQ268_23465 [Oculatella sp. LEGE 06141]|uniref:hypothetical protein n=1 Tax=Oculatella sp. LEGE 06141 TaxID=1828648 RepID=UPI00187E8FF6|nr:hypothetical protein [Oculatella sp. LEGE 06141]MBE9181525.1 hypothetical protein [Oculatella sp. LEGE 06141]